MATPVQIIKEFIKKSGCFLYGIFIVVIGFRAIFEPTHTEFVFFLSMILVAFMGGGAFWAFRIYRSKTSNLKPGDTNASDATQDSE